MPPKRQFTLPKTEERKRKRLEDCIRKVTSNAKKWTFKVFSEWQISRNNKDPSQEQCSFKVDLAKIQSLDLNVANMKVESLNRLLNMKHYLKSHLQMKLRFLLTTFALY